MTAAREYSLEGRAHVAEHVFVSASNIDVRIFFILNDTIEYHDFILCLQMLLRMGFYKENTLDTYPLPVLILRTNVDEKLLSVPVE